MVPSGSAAGVWAEPLGGARSSAASCSPAETGMRQGGGGSRPEGGTRPGLTAVGERKALRVAARVAAEGEQQRGGAQAQRPGRRWEGAVEDAEQAAGGGVAQLQPVARVSQLEEAEGELQRRARRAKSPTAVPVRPVLVRKVRGVDDALRCSPVPLAGAH